MKVTVTYTLKDGTEGVKVFNCISSAMAWLNNRKFPVEEYDLLFGDSIE